jgi:hypothetical protein
MDTTNPADTLAMLKNKNIERMARLLTGMLASMRRDWESTARVLGDNATREPEGRSGLAWLDADAVTALRRLTDELGHSWRVRLDLRARELWREQAIMFPHAAELTRTSIGSGNGDDPARYADQVHVQRTDTGQHYLVSTNDVETYVFPCDADGNRTDSSEIPCVSGRGVTRAEAIRGIDRTDAARLVTWTDYRADDDDDD